MRSFLECLWHIAKAQQLLVSLLRTHKVGACKEREAHPSMGHILEVLGGPMSPCMGVVKVLIPWAPRMWLWKKSDSQAVTQCSAQ